jgi:hypothetical protein
MHVERRLLLEALRLDERYLPDTLRGDERNVRYRRGLLFFKLHQRPVRRAAFAEPAPRRRVDGRCARQSRRTSCVRDHRSIVREQRRLLLGAVPRRLLRPAAAVIRQCERRREATALPGAS